jgi:hypothetical protein
MNRPDSALSNLGQRIMQAMADGESASAGRVQLYVAHHPPAWWDEMDAHARVYAADSGAEPDILRRPALVSQQIDWAVHGVEPCWLGMETSGCAAALDPSFFESQGANELKRFLAGTAARGETAVLVCTIGAAEKAPTRRFFGGEGTSILLGDTTSIDGQRLPVGAKPKLAADVDPFDRDLGLRLLNRAADAPWWAVRLAGLTLLRGDGSGSSSTEPEGRLIPVLQTDLGETVVGYWDSPDSRLRWYVIPDGTEWSSIIDWLLRQALPALAPGVLRRVRSRHLVDPDLFTPDETAAVQALDELERQYDADKALLGAHLTEAHARADPIRYGLLYETDRLLVGAVAAVLRDAGLTVDDLDTELGVTWSADLLAHCGGASSLVEVKSASGRPPESLVGDVQRHLATWPDLRPDQPVTHGVLVINHQHRLEPRARDITPYTRRAFVATTTIPVVTTTALFDWWRRADWGAIRAAILPAPNDAAHGTGSPAERTQPAGQQIRRSHFRRNRRPDP